jgi:glycosyltransferase involved in cell wall biosynthesis
VKIAFVCGFAWEPKGTVRARAHPLAAELQRRGHEVRIIVVPYDNPVFSGVVDKVQGVVVENVRVDCSPLARVKHVLKALRTFDADLVHIFKPKGYAGLVAFGLLAQGRRNLILDCDDWEGWGGWNEVADHSWFLKEFIDIQERSLVRFVPAVTVASRVLDDRAKSLGQKNISYLPNCFPDANLPLFDSCTLTTDRGRKLSMALPGVPIVLYAGHFNPADDIEFVCIGMKQVLADSTAAFVLVGDGPELQKARAMYTGSNRVRFLGRLPYEEYVAVVHAADVAIFPYPQNAVYRAKCSARIIDFMAAGKAVVTTEVGQNSEYIRNGVTGVLVPPNDTPAFSKAVLTLLANQAEREELGKRAASAVREQFLWSGSVTDTCEALYRNVYASSASGKPKSMVNGAEIKIPESPDASE